MNAESSLADSSSAVAAASKSLRHSHACPQICGMARVYGKKKSSIYVPSTGTVSSGVIDHTYKGPLEGQVQRISAGCTDRLTCGRTPREVVPARVTVPGSILETFWDS